MKTKIPAAARVLLGLIFFVFGLNGFLHFLPQPPPETPAAGAFIQALIESTYMIPLLKITEVIAGVLLLGNRFVPLALTVLAPIVVNIAAFHFVLAPKGAPVALVVIALEVYLAYVYRRAFAPLFVPEVVPSGARPAREAVMPQVSRA